MIEHKRLKSALITLGGFVLTAITAVVTGPLWPSFVEWANTSFSNQLLAWGIPAAAGAIVVAFFGELIRQIVNAIIASKEGYSSTNSVGVRRNVDLF